MGSTGTYSRFVGVNGDGCLGGRRGGGSGIASLPANRQTSLHYFSNEDRRVTRLPRDYGQHDRAVTQGVSALGITACFKMMADLAISSSRTSHGHPFLRHWTIEVTRISGRCRNLTMRVASQ
jgi:hypothetical protein